MTTPQLIAAAFFLLPTRSSAFWVLRTFWRMRYLSPLNGLVYQCVIYRGDSSVGEGMRDLHYPPRAHTFPNMIFVYPCCIWLIRCTSPERVGAMAIAKLGTGGFNCDLFSGPLKRLPHSRLKKKCLCGSGSVYR